MTVARGKRRRKASNSSHPSPESRFQPRLLGLALKSDGLTEAGRGRSAVPLVLLCQTISHRPRLLSISVPTLL